MINKARRLLNREGIKLFLKSIAGDSAPDIAYNLLTPISDEALAEKCGMRVADARMMLNKMHNMGIIDYNRSKDKESGWYYYSWFLRADKLLDTYIKKKKNDLEGIEKQLENKDAYDLFFCPSCEQTYDAERANDLFYHCPLCERILDKELSESDFKKMRKIAANLKKEINEVQKEFKAISEMKYKTMKVI